MMKNAGCLSSVVSEIRKQLETKGTVDKAARSQKYLKSEMPCCGVSVPDRRKIVNSIFADAFTSSKNCIDLTPEGWRNAVTHIWDNAKYREERSAAIDLLRWKRSEHFLTLDALPLVEKIIVEGAWWDLVDDAVNALGVILKSNPSAVKTRLLAWSTDFDVWKRRASIISQLQFKSETDFDFMQSCIAPNLDHPDFFVRKGIGWALRDYAWHNPFAVQAYVDFNHDKLSPLSRREAMKNMDPNQPGRVGGMRM